MGLNVGYLTSDRTSAGDNVYTPFYAIDPIVKYLPKDKIIWCPFDERWSAYVQSLQEYGFKVIRSSINDGQDFFNYEPEKWDIIISNPPFSLKDKILERCYKFNKPFMLLLPLPSLQGIKRHKLFKDGLELLVFDKRINYHTNENFDNVTNGNHFASVYFCRNILPEKLILEELNVYERKLK